MARPSRHDPKVMKKTIALVRRTKPDDIGVSVSYPLPGTKFHERVQATMNGKVNWSDSEDLSVMFKSPYTDAFYRALHDGLHADVEQWSRPAPAGMPVTQDLQPERRQELWRRVEEMEKLCRNTAPTVLAPELVYLQAD